MSAVSALVEAEVNRFPMKSTTFWHRAACAAINPWPDA